MYTHVDSKYQNYEACSSHHLNSGFWPSPSALCQAPPLFLGVLKGTSETQIASSTYCGHHPALPCSTLFNDPLSVSIVTTWCYLSRPPGGARPVLVIELREGGD